MEQPRKLDNYTILELLDVFESYGHKRCKKCFKDLENGEYIACELENLIEYWCKECYEKEIFE